jgi:hypothetical protein
MDKEGKLFDIKKFQFLFFFFCLVVRTDALKGRRGRLPSKPKSPSSRQPNSFQTQFCRFYNDSIPNPANLDFSKLNVSLSDEGTP